MLMSKSEEKQLYFLAVIPPEPVYSEAQTLKQLFADEYNSKAALRSPPHVTLHMPFLIKPEKESELLQVLVAEFVKPTPFEIRLDGFGQFKQRVIYIKIEPSDQLEALHKSLQRVMKQNFNIFNADYKDRGFNPHLTVAFRDLKKQEFKNAWSQFKDRDFSANVLVNSFSLLKHNGKHWEVFKDFELRKEN